MVHIHTQKNGTWAWLSTYESQIYDDHPTNALDILAMMAEGLMVLLQGEEELLIWSIATY